MAIKKDTLDQLLSGRDPNSTASRTVVVGEVFWSDHLTTWALMQGFDECEGQAFSDRRD